VILVKVLAIMGSPRKTGNTYKVTRKVEECMKQLGDMEFEYVFLKDMRLGQCLGCQVCFDKGEDKCPLKDDRAMLEEKIHNADGVIFASPTYTFNVSGLMKNFFDRFGYACHRPRFFKSALVLTTSGVGMGANIMMISFKLVPQTWGFKVTSLNVMTNGIPEFNPPQQKTDKKIAMAANKFYRSVAAGRPKPGLLSMAAFMVSHFQIRKIPEEMFDHRYYKDHGWLEKTACYYYDPQAGVLKKMLARQLAKFLGVFT
jgi:multimeric flavodoxin WrbA